MKPERPGQAGTPSTGSKAGREVGRKRRGRKDAGYAKRPEKPSKA